MGKRSRFVYFFPVYCLEGEHFFGTFAPTFQTTTILKAFRMKKIIIFAALLVVSLSGLAQNVQFHYDLGHALSDDLENRPAVTTTVEMFKPDAWGSTFLFTDLDYFSDGVAGAYWEVSRELNVSANKQWAAHVEYNGGLSSDKERYTTSRFQHAFLVGPAWNWHSADFSRTFSLQAMYKRYFKGQYASAFNSFQATAVWSVSLANSLFTFSGFLDYWYNPDVDGKWILLSEPQFWLNLNSLRGMNGVNLSVGTEIEVSNNFVWNKNGENNHFYAIPTLAFKWTF